MQEEFDDDHAVAREIALKTTDVFEPLFPDILCDERFGNFLRREQMLMYAHDEHFLVIRAIEDTDFAPFRHSLVRAPEIIVIELFGAWRLKGVNVAALRVHAGHNVLDRAI